jgi:hypothetical protein
MLFVARRDGDGSAQPNHKKGHETAAQFSQQDLLKLSQPKHQLRIPTIFFK